MIASKKSAASIALYLALSHLSLCCKQLNTSSVGLNSGEYGGNAMKRISYKSHKASAKPMLSPWKCMDQLSTTKISPCSKTPFSTSLFTNCRYNAALVHSSITSQYTGGISPPFKFTAAKIL